MNAEIFLRDPEALGPPGTARRRGQALAIALRARIGDEATEGLLKGVWSSAQLLALEALVRQAAIKTEQDNRPVRTPWRKLDWMQKLHRVRGDTGAP